jgi:YkoY family integral membrane protein
MLLESLVAIGTLILLEGILSVDNALAMALQVKALAPSQQRRALLYGMWGALLFRGLAILGARWLLSVWWLQIAGAFYLLYLAIAHFAFRRETHQLDGAEGSSRGFWATVAIVEFTDAAFALDSTLVAVGISDQLWVVLSGVALGIVAVRYAAMLFVKLLERFPEIEQLGFVLVGWVAVRLMSEGFEKMSAAVLLKPYHEHILPEWVFWTGVGIVALIGGWFMLRGRWGIGTRISESSKGFIDGCEKLVDLLPFTGNARRIVVLIIGILLLAIGVALIFLPGPAIVVIPAGLAILATEFQWARSLLNKGKTSMRRILGRA